MNEKKYKKKKTYKYIINQFRERKVQIRAVAKASKQNGHENKKKKKPSQRPYVCMYVNIYIPELESLV